MTDRWPYRLRVHGGHATHAAGHTAGFADPVTACGRVSGPGDENRDETADVTCKSCIREMDQ